jgi:hypothetical protein
VRNRKNGFDLKLVDDAGDDREVGLLGLGVTDRWILYAPYVDKTMMRNTIGMEIARELGLVATATQHVELVVAGEYVGIYVLTRKITKDLDCAPGDAPGTCLPDRPPLEHTPLGGFILARDGVQDDPAEFVTTARGNIPITFVHPDDPARTPAVAAYVAAFEDALCAPGFADPIAGYRAWLEVEGFVDYVLLREIFKDIDGYRRSLYFYVNDEGRLVIGPVWDFDAGSGGLMINLQKGWRLPDRDWALDYDLPWLIDVVADDPDRPLPWIERLTQDPAFVARLRERWDEIKVDVLGLEELHPGDRCEPERDVPGLWRRVLAQVRPLALGCGVVDELGAHDPFDDRDELDELDAPIDALPGACAIKRNFGRWDQMGKESPARDTTDSGTPYWDEGPAYFGRRFRRNCAGQVPDLPTYRRTYADVLRDWRVWLSDRAEWIDAHLDELGPATLEIDAADVCLRFE